LLPYWPPPPTSSPFLYSSCSGCHRDLHSFPTRRSSDLGGDRHVHAVADEHGRARERRQVQAPALDRAVQLLRQPLGGERRRRREDRKSTRLNSSHVKISYAVFCLKKKKKKRKRTRVSCS